MIRSIAVAIWVVFNIFIMYQRGGFFSMYFEHSSEYVVGAWFAFLVMTVGGSFVIIFVAKKISERKKKSKTV